LAVNQQDRSRVRPNYQEVLRSVGAWLDMRGYQDIRITEGPEGLIIEGLPAEDSFDGEHERLLLDNELIQRFCEASRQNRFAPPPLSPTLSRAHLTLVPYEIPWTESEE
jgi:hypothetical protein